MYIKQFYTACLSQAAYYIESEGEAAVIDPMRDIQPYTDLARERNATIKYVFETHFHADFVSGHKELSRETGCLIVFGPQATPHYDAVVAEDGQEFELGKINIRVLHTPGHTIESSCFLVVDEWGKNPCIFTGDTLFVGDVGRPDLLSGNLSKEALAGQLFDSIQKKIKPLQDEVVVYPGHGKGSACGKNIGPETWSTIGIQKEKNYALQPMVREAFIHAVTDGQPEAPAYFFADAKLNKEGAEDFSEIIKKSNQPLSIRLFNTKREAGAKVLDTRSPNLFGTAFIPGSINIGLGGDFAIWAGTILNYQEPILLVCSPGEETESITRLARVGYEKVEGFLDGGIIRWITGLQPTDTIPGISMREAMQLMNEDEAALLDVRKTVETDKLRLRNALEVPLTQLPNKIYKINKQLKYIVCCSGGYRSMIAASMLKMAGIREVYNINGGVNSFKEHLPELLEAAG